MHKKKRSKKRNFCLKDYPSISLKKGAKIKKFDAGEKLRDFDVVASAFFEALQDDDVECALEILEGYLMTKKKSDLSKRGKIASSTLYQSLSKKANPTLKTVARILHAAL
jgi:probable addiction module antidote protein